MFSVPVSTSRLPAPAWGARPHKNKRKRSAADDGEDEGRHDDNLVVGLGQPDRPASAIEYSAVVSPAERVQRRLAGQPLDEEPPPFPFPHAAAPGPVARDEDDQYEAVRPPLPALSPEAPRSLHLRHLAALVAVLHRSMLRQDYARASRALGIMFRDDFVGQGTAAVRNHGYFGVAAEVLLLRRRRRHEAHGPSDDGRPPGLPIAPQGFEDAKRFYERLIIRHPYHKAWPDSVNAIDFYLALFNIWIFVVHTEARTRDRSLSDDEASASSREPSPSLDGDPRRARTRRRELDQARHIAARMDTVMATVPFMDEVELIRLRDHVAHWVADLSDDASPGERPQHEPRARRLD